MKKMFVTIIAAMGLCLSAQTPAPKTPEKAKAVEAKSSETTSPLPTINDADMVKLLTISAEQASLIIQSNQLEKQQLDLREKYTTLQQRSAIIYSEVTKHYKVPDGYGLQQVNATTFQFIKKN
jgi:hypothetical protein